MKKVLFVFVVDFLLLASVASVITYSSLENGCGMGILILLGLILALLSLGFVCEFEDEPDFGKKAWLLPAILFLFVFFNEGIGREVERKETYSISSFDTNIYREVLDIGMKNNSIAREGAGGVKVAVQVESFNEDLDDIVNAAKKAATTITEQTIVKKYYRRLWQLKEIK